MVAIAANAITPRPSASGSSGDILVTRTAPSIESLPPEILLGLMERFLDLPSLGSFVQASSAIHGVQHLLGSTFAQAADINKEAQTIFAGQRAGEPVVGSAQASPFIQRHGASVLEGLQANKAGLVRLAWRKAAHAILACQSRTLPPAQGEHCRALYEALVADLARIPAGASLDRGWQRLVNALCAWQAPIDPATYRPLPSSQHWLIAQAAELLSAAPKISTPVARPCVSSLMTRIAAPVCMLKYTGDKGSGLLLGKILDGLKSWPDQEAALAGLASFQSQINAMPRAAAIQRLVEKALSQTTAPTS